MFQPKIPTMPQPSGLVTPPAVIQPTTITPGMPAPAPAAAPEPSRPVVQLTPGTAFALVGAGTAVVMVVGTVLVSLLLAVAVTSTSVAVCAVVLRSLIASDAKHR
ncbi:SpdD-like protein [Streptomyces sp. NBC_01089]|uniref:SpdD-like protein n=1 Tax=Streptomyces sp. NBC_01089 TaxID=2903747 RepID=UPI0038687C9C|nr:SpdD-like protein [Streptomyces sp. NBC_01089]